MRILCWPSTATAVFLFAGCDSGPKLVVVRGIVTCDGKPLDSGEVSLVPEEPGMAPDGGTISAGVFTLKARAGRKKVVIRASRPMANPPRGADLGNPPREDFLPARYNDQTTLSATIGPDAVNEFKFDLSSK